MPTSRSPFLLQQLSTDAARIAFEHQQYGNVSILDGSVSMNNEDFYPHDYELSSTI
jgi:hypothetical protein